MDPLSCGDPQEVSVSLPTVRQLPVLAVSPRQARATTPTSLMVSLDPMAAAWLRDGGSAVRRTLFCRLVGAAKHGSGDLLLPAEFLPASNPFEVLHP